jgi:hypothetical protein
MGWFHNKGKLRVDRGKTLLINHYKTVVRMQLHYCVESTALLRMQRQPWVQIKMQAPPKAVPTRTILLVVPELMVS